MFEVLTRPGVIIGSESARRQDDRAADSGSIIVQKADKDTGCHEASGTDSEVTALRRSICARRQAVKLGPQRYSNLHNGGHELKRAERCPPVEGTPEVLFMGLIHYLAIIYVQLLLDGLVTQRLRNR